MNRSCMLAGLLATTTAQWAAGAENGLTWNWSHDPQGRLQALTAPGGIRTLFQYAVASNAAGTVTDTMTRGSDTFRFTRDAAGRLLAAEGGAGSVRLAYTPAGLPAEVAMEGRPALRYAFNELDQLTELRIGEQTVLRYQYDFLGRLAALVSPAGRIEYSYDLSRNLTFRQLPNGVRTVREHDDEGRLAKLTHADPKGYILAEYAYAYRPDGLLEQVSERNARDGACTWRFSYDKMKRLTAETFQGKEIGHRQYRYDSLGNLAAMTGGTGEIQFSSTPAGALIADSRGPCASDERGHITRLTTAGRTLDFTFTPGGELASAGSVAYRYNALGLLTARTQAGVETAYLPDPFADAWQPLWRREGQGAETVTLWADGFPLADLQGSDVRWRLEDHLGSGRLETDARGNVVAWRTYTPYGEPENEPGSAEPRFGFAGLFWDPAARLYLARARAYDPASARFLQPDPQLRIPGASPRSHSLYAYCGGDPVNWADRNGADPVPVITRNDIEKIIQDLVRQEMSKGIVDNPFFPNYKRCYDWQELVFNRLYANEDFVRNWEIIPYGRVDNPQGTAVGHYFNVVRSRITGEAYTVDPWKGITVLDNRIAIPAPASIKERAQLTPFVPKHNYAPWAMGTDRFYNMSQDEVRQTLLAPKRPSTATPSPVGGVFLGGAGEALAGLGRLKGVAVDETTGKLLLIGEDGTRSDLPPLRLDDVVTVFRAVFDHGQSPTVTIDPDENEPEGPIMRVKHGPATAGTYVGWVLFECDRIMKTYQLGCDNITGKPLVSAVPGHAETMDSVLFGEGTARGALAPVRYWERFWIVPASVRRYDAALAGLSLFDLPLKVNTQRMKWEGRKLVDDKAGKPSVGALAFTRWFTASYDAIADEVRVPPPAGSGRTEPVPVFRELQRIATVAAIAERLRDQGHSLPAWMREHAVAPCAVSETTPALKDVREKKVADGTLTTRIYGGVNLAPADKDVRAYAAAAPKSAGAPPPVPAEDAPFVQAAKQATAALESALPEAAQAAELPAKAVPLPDLPGQPKLAAVVLPGADTLALAPNRLTVPDLTVPIGLGRAIRLTRHYHSFFDPAGDFGRGWTLDLPELREEPVPAGRDGYRANYTLVPHLVSPLGSHDARFDRLEKVAPFNVKLLVAADHPEIAGLGGEAVCDLLGQSARPLYFRDGREWHFDDKGRLLLDLAEGVGIRYVRGADGRVERIQGYIGKALTGAISLAYDARGRITRATSEQPEDFRRQAPADAGRIDFAYDTDGRLASVTKDGNVEPSQGYAYEKSLLTAVREAGTPARAFTYNTRGQLVSEQQEAERKEYAITPKDGKTVLTETRPRDGSEEKWTFDPQLRPLILDLDREKKVSWDYGQDKEVRQTFTVRGQPRMTRHVSPDGRTETATLADGSTFRVQRDEAGRPLELARQDRTVARLNWTKNGDLGVVKLGGATELRPVHHPDGWRKGLTLSAPANPAGKLSQWLEEEWDILGRPCRITDSTGLDYRLAYDGQGRLKSMGRLTGPNQLTGTSLAYDPEGRLARIESSWQRETREFGAKGGPKRMTVERPGGTESLHFDDEGRLLRHEDFDGGRTVFHYDSKKGTLSGLDLPDGGAVRMTSLATTNGVREETRLGPARVAWETARDNHSASLTWAGLRAEAQ